MNVQPIRDNCFEFQREKVEKGYSYRAPAIVDGRSATLIFTESHVSVKLSNEIRQFPIQPAELFAVDELQTVHLRYLISVLEHLPPIETN